MPLRHCNTMVLKTLWFIMLIQYPTTVLETLWFLIQCVTMVLDTLWLFMFLQCVTMVLDILLLPNVKLVLQCNGSKYSYWQHNAFQWFLILFLSTVQHKQAEQWYFPILTGTTMVLNFNLTGFQLKQKNLSRK